MKLDYKKQLNLYPGLLFSLLQGCLVDKLYASVQSLHDSQMKLSATSESMKICNLKRSDKHNVWYEYKMKTITYTKQSYKFW